MAKSPDLSKFPWCRVEKLRAEKNISKKALAERLQLNYSYLVDLLNGHYHGKIDSDKLAALADIFQMPLESLLKEVSPESISQAAPSAPPQPEPPPPAAPEITDHLSGETLALLTNPPYPPELALRLMDDSMSPPFLKGTVFITDTGLTNPAQPPAIGRLVVAAIRNGCIWIRELYKIDDEWVLLKPYNKACEYLQVARQDIIILTPVISIRLPARPD